MFVVGGIMLGLFGVFMALTVIGIFDDHRIDL